MSGGIDWKQRSLSDLKAAAKAITPKMLTQSITYYQTGADAVSQAQDDFMVQVNSLGDAWQGDAAQAAVANAKQAQQTMRQTHSSATTSSAKTQAYSQQMQDQQQQVEAVPNVDTSWGHAAKSGGWGGLLGIGVAKAAQQHQYDQNRDKAAQIITKMDTNGQSHASDMQSVQWPQGGGANVGAPPSTLPPVPGAAKGPGGGSDGGYPGSPGTNAGSPAYSAPVICPGTSKSDHAVLNGPKGPKGPSGPGTTPQGGGTPPPNLPTSPQGGNGGPTPVGSAPGGPVEGLPPGAGGAGGAGAAAAVLGGAGLLGAGALGGRAGFAGAGGDGARLGGSAGDGERLGARGGAADEFGSGKGLGAGTGAGEGAGEGANLRGRAGLGNSAGAPEDGLGARDGSMLRTGSGSGFAGEPVAAEAGRMGGYPMGGSGGRRRNDDEEAPVPDYLVETDDIWGDGASAAPPVIGE